MLSEVQKGTTREIMRWDFTGRPVVKTPCSQRKVLSLSPWSKTRSSTPLLTSGEAK